MRWAIQREVRGIDILMTHVSPDFKIVIENKWFARDQDQQTIRYWRRQLEESRGRLDTIPVLYLAPRLREPSFDSSVEPPAEFRRDLRSISYGTDIRIWLTNAMPQIGSPRVKETIGQYLDLLEAFREH